MTNTERRTPNAKRQTKYINQVRTKTNAYETKASILLKMKNMQAKN
jgi:hypothetical protein